MQFVFATVSIAFFLSLACALFAWSVLNLGEWVIMTLLALAVGIVLTGGTQRLSRWAYRLSTAFAALRSLYYLPQEQLDNFLKSYELFDQEAVGERGNEATNIVNYYAVLNHLCSIGEVEKMYIPPILDPERSITENQEIFEKKICADLNITPESKVLDVGCGRGRVLAHIAQTTGAKELHGLNIDEVQLSNARRYAKEQGLNHLHYTHGNFNDPLLFPDATFDALYQIQVLTYTKDKKSPLFRNVPSYETWC
jgi:sterol 24-C-methyltransferase